MKMRKELLGMPFVERNDSWYPFAFDIYLWERSYEVFINDPAVIEMGNIYFKYVSFSMPLFTGYLIYNSALIGAGKTILTMIGDILRLWGIRIPIIAYLSMTMGFKGIFIGMIISNLVVFVVTYIFFRFSNWKKAVV